MSDTTMLQSIVSSIALMRQEMKDGFKKVNEKIDKVDKRVDNLGKSLAYLEDDAPTRGEHTKLEKRVTKLEQITAPV